MFINKYFKIKRPDVNTLLNMFGMSTQTSSSLSSTSLSLPVSKPRNLSHAPPQQSNQRQQQQQHSNSNFALQFDALEARLLKRIDDRFDLLESRLSAKLDLLGKSLSAKKEDDRRDEQQATPESKC